MLEAWVYGLKSNFLVAPKIITLYLCTLVALKGVALSDFRVSGVAKLDEDGFTLTRALDGSAEEALGGVGDSGFHGIAHDLGDAHALSQSMAGLDNGPLELVIFYVLLFAQFTCGRFKWTSGTQVTYLSSGSIVRGRNGKTFPNYHLS